eukprot:scaffold6779_cov161-Amphora_coffeaeformis.AAC.1
MVLLVYRSCRPIIRIRVSGNLNKLFPFALPCGRVQGTAANASQGSRALIVGSGVLRRVPFRGFFNFVFSGRLLASTSLE